MELENAIKQRALELGFDLVGITDTAVIDSGHVSRLRCWVDSGRAAEMKYMHRNFEKRIDPAKLMGGARSVICVGLNFNPGQAVQEDIPHSAIGKVARYARYEDYHGFIKKRLFALADFIAEFTGSKPKIKACVDSAPLAERALAERAGLGFIGKNRMLINPRLGLEILLGELLTDLPLEVDGPIQNHCPDCDKCIRACPTGALAYDGTLDARKCISYLTIEHKGDIPADMVPKISDRFFGCDCCVLACPWQKLAGPCSNEGFRYHSDWASLDMREIIDMSEQEFNRKFADSPLLRTGLDKLKQNARVCFENYKDQPPFVGD